MKTSFPYLPFPALWCLGCIVALAGLTGCVTVRQMPVEVTSPPPPLIGSAPIVAQDAYARSLFPQTPVTDRALVMLLRSSLDSRHAVKPKSSSALIPAGLN